MDDGFDMTEAFASVAVRFKEYGDLLRGVAEGRIRHLFVEGDQGLGKTYTLERILRTYEAKKAIRLHISSGRTTPLGLFNDLYSNRHKHSITVFDDCDAVLENKDTLNILKAATDTKDRREISWATTSNRAQVQKFIFEGQVVLLTNLNMEKPKFAPLMDRVYRLPMRLTPQERVARCIMVIREDTKFHYAHDDVTMWLIRNHGALGDKVTIRTAGKLLELAAFNKDKWEALATRLILGDDR